MSRSSLIFAVVALAMAAGVLTAISSVTRAAPPLSGAIFTTTPDGGIVNENVRYTSKLEVYLDGGPPPNAPVSSAGLPVGDYVFQITDPSGGAALSQDASRCRVVHVDSGGFITNRVDPIAAGGASTDSGLKVKGVPIPCHIDDDPPHPTNPGVTGASGQHDTNFDVDHGGEGAIVVQMMPFLDTPNPGGVYKAWMMPLGDYVANGGDLDETPKVRGMINNRGNKIGFRPDPGFGPPRSQSKTDNFKVVLEVPPAPTADLHVLKFEDTNANGVQDEGELGDVGWQVFITDPTEVTNEHATPVWITAEPIGDYIVEEGSVAGWEQSVVTVDGVDLGITNPVTVTVTAGGEHEVVFGNFRRGGVEGIKYEDLDGDGVRDEGEPGFAGVTINLDGTDGMGAEVHESTITDADGAFSFSGIKPGSYTVSEEVPAGSDASTATSIAVDISSGETVLLGDVFGNFKFAEIHGVKFEDMNGNGVNDGEPGVAGVTITLSGTADATTVTDANGEFWFMELAPGTYQVSETVPAGWVASTDTSSGDITLLSGGSSTDTEFGNFRPAEIHGAKFEDSNGNGSWDAGEPGMGGVTVTLTGEDGKGNPVNIPGETMLGGGFWFVDLAPGSYTVTETVPAGMVASTPTSSGPHALESGDNVQLGFVFGNVIPVDIHAHKFFDFDSDGIQDPNESDLAGILICLSTGTGDPVTEDAFGNPVATCQETDEDGLVWWMDIAPGDYTVAEDLVNSSLQGLTPVTDVAVAITVISSQAPVTVEFANHGACNGLTPGYWKNWRNHYTDEQFASLLQGTIADVGDDTADIARADEIFAHWDASDPVNDPSILNAFVLANQLTLNLTQSALPNPSGGSLFGACLLLDSEGDGTLGDTLAQALDYLARLADGDPNNDPTASEILAAKDILDAFANQQTG